MSRKRPNRDLTQNGALNKRARRGSEQQLLLLFTAEQITGIVRDHGSMVLALQELKDKYTALETRHTQFLNELMEERRPEGPLANVPDEILWLIFAYFTADEHFSRLECVCTRWAAAIRAWTQQLDVSADWDIIFPPVLVPLIAKYTAVRELSLARCASVTGNHILELVAQHMPFLEHLDLYQCPLHNYEVLYDALPALFSMRVGDSGFTDTHFLALPRQKLQRLEITWATEFTYNVVHCLAQLPVVRTFMFSDNDKAFQHWETVVTTWAQCKDNEALRASLCLPPLEILSLRRTTLNARCMEAIVNTFADTLYSIEFDRLYISVNDPNPNVFTGRPYADHPEIPELAQCPQFRVFSWRYMHSGGALDFFPSLYLSMPNLVSLDVQLERSWNVFTSDTLLCTVACLPNLRYLRLVGLLTASDTGYVALAELSLTHLLLYGAHLLDVPTLNRMLEPSRPLSQSLEYFTGRACPKLDPSGLIAFRVFSKNCPRLKRLTYNRDVYTPAELDALAQREEEDTIIIID